MAPEMISCSILPSKRFLKKPLWIRSPLRTNEMIKIISYVDTAFSRIRVFFCG